MATVYTKIPTTKSSAKFGGSFFLAILVLVASLTPAVAQPIWLDSAQAAPIPKIPSANFQSSSRPLQKKRDPILEKAASLYKKGNGEAARAIYDEYLTLHPKSDEAGLGLARIAIRQHDYELAKDQLEETLRYHPENAEVAAELGYLFLRWSNSPFDPQDYMARAEEHLQQAYLIDPNNAYTITYFGFWQLQQGDLVTAHKSFRQAISINPAFVPAHHGLILYYLQVSDMTRAKDTALHAMELDAYNARTYYLIAKLLTMADHPGDALKYAQRSEQLDFGRDPDRDYLLASQYEKLGDLDKAANYYQMVLSYAPNHSDSWLKLGKLQSRLGDAKNSQKSLQQASSLNPQLLHQTTQQALTLTRSGNPTAALSPWHQVIQMDPNNTMAKRMVAAIHYWAWRHQQPIPPGQPIVSFSDSNQLDPLLIALGREVSSGTSAQSAVSELAPPLPDYAAQQLKTLVNSGDPQVSGESALLLGQFAVANEKLELLDGNTPEDTAAMADRLMLLKAFNHAKALYQRAYGERPDPGIRKAVALIDAEEQAAQAKLQQGNQSYDLKKYAEAVRFYQAAIDMNPQLSSAYMRLGDTYERQKNRVSAYYAFQSAAELNPGLLTSRAFSRKLRKLEKKVLSLKARAKQTTNP